MILDSCCGKAKNRASHSPTTGGHSKHFSDPRGFVQLFSSCHVVLGMVVGLDITITYVVGGFKHFIVSIIYGIIPPLTNIFQDGWLKPPTSYVYKCVCVYLDLEILANEHPLQIQISHMMIICRMTRCNI